jgi:Domain of unknown function (DUF4352)
MASRWNPPPNWPAAPSPDWQPPQGWQPPADWGPAPEGWEFWLDDGAGAPVAGAPQNTSATSGGWQQPSAATDHKGNWIKRHKVLSALGAVVVFIIVVSSLSGGGDDPSSTASDSQPSATESASGSGAASPTKSSTAKASAPAESASQLGKKVRDGKFEFTVTKVKCGRTLVGSSDFGKKAQGEFCEVSLSVKNIGDEPQSMFGDNQYLFDSKERKYSADTEAAIYLKDSNTLYEEINPGNSLKGTLLFDVPKGTKPAKLELHDSLLSGGVDVRL